MCYERMFLKGWATRKVRQRTEPERAVERATSSAPPMTNRAPHREVERRKEVEREVEEII